MISSNKYAPYTFVFGAYLKQYMLDNFIIIIYYGGRL